MVKHNKFFLLFLLGKIVSVLGEKQAEFNLNFQQNDYQIKPEHADVVSYDKKYMNKVEMKTFKYNRTTTAFNCTFNYAVEMNNNIEMVLQAYKFASNEYRLFPLRFSFNMCDAFKANSFGIRENWSCGNWTMCPYTKNQQYYLCNWSIDQTKFPPFIPSGRYMADVQALLFSKEIFFIRFYAEVMRPLVSNLRG